MIKAIIFDLNGIFIESKKLSDRFAEDFGITQEAFLPKLAEIMDKVRQPNAGPAFAYWQPVLSDWGVSFSEAEFWNYWFRDEKPVAAMIDLARTLKSKGLRLFLLSNNFQERAEFYGHYPWLNELFEKVYFSWQTGLVKPDPRAWQKVLDDAGLIAGECLYFDDQEKNTSTASSLGIRSFLLTDSGRIKEVIEQNEIQERPI